MIINTASVEFRWSLQVGDPTVSGWLITAAYIFVGLMSFKVFSGSKGYDLQEYKVWFYLALMFFGLGMNKQLDLQTIISDVGRWVATRLNLMEYRHLFKRAFIFGLFVSLVSFVWYYRIPLKSFIKKYRIVGFGSALVIFFIFARALSFHIFSIPFNEFLAHFEVYLVWEAIALTLTLVGVLKAMHMIYESSESHK
ncbi:MAG: hypothetical protein MK132_22790 [Lentisphaerales bacterium]|nr:hypothetical protein [Lentisphaerales bacterium]